MAILSRFCLVVALVPTLGAADQVLRDPDFPEVGRIGVQDNGRVKPLDTYGREVVARITGRAGFRVKDTAVANALPGGNALALLLSWTFEPEKWSDVPLFRLDYRPLKERLGLPADQTYFRVGDLVANEQFLGLCREADAARAAGGNAKPGRLHREALNVRGRIELARQILQGYGAPMVPNRQGTDAAWFAWPEAPARHPRAVESGAVSQWQRLGEAFRKRDASAFREASAELRTTLNTLWAETAGPEAALIQSAKLQWEVDYNQLKPFRKACWLYGLGLVLLMVSLSFKESRKVYGAGLVALGGGLALQSCGFLVRAWITGFAPVANMYESMVFMGFMLTVLGLGFEAIYRSRVFALAASALAIALLVLADQLPLDRGLDPLMPVLRSNYWLTLHVLTVMSAYAALTLAMGIGHINLGLHFFAAQRKELMQRMTVFLYRTLCLGFLLMTAGTILGAWWAGEAWGRYWGWDPKEVWSLICIFGYGILLHGRLAGFWGAFGLAVGSVVAWCLVGMTYYGVNFVLGTGLHSYGFGDGGVQFAAGYLVVEALVVAASLYGKYGQESRCLRQSSGKC